jgi:hypothetical protein
MLFQQAAQTPGQICDEANSSINADFSLQPVAGELLALLQ